MRILTTGRIPTTYERALTESDAGLRKWAGLLWCQMHNNRHQQDLRAQDDYQRAEATTREIADALLDRYAKEA